VRRHTGKALGHSQTPRYGRRSIIVAFAALLVASKRMGAQQASPKIPRVGILAPAETDKTTFFDAFRAGMRDLGWSEGRNIILEFRLAHFDWTLLPRLAQELVNLPVEVIVSSGGPAARIAMEATRDIPIVTIGVDPALFDLVESLARPRVNVTGFSFMAPELTPKRLELLRTAFPHISTVAVLVNTANPASKSYLQATEEAARSLGLPIVALVEAASVDALLALRPTAFGDASAVVVMQDGLLWNHRREVLALVNSAPAGYLRRTRIRRRRRADLLRSKYLGQLPPGGRLRGSHPEGGQAWRSADPAAGQVRLHSQSQDRRGARPDGSSVHPRPRR
jgi:putative ABC transport system substrate-binding protein